MKRQDFSLKYLVALYLHHRANPSGFATVASLQSYYDLPIDEYLESEIPEFLASRGWANFDRSMDEKRDWPLHISMGGKEAAEAEVENGTTVSEKTAEQSSVDVGLVPASDRVVRLDHNQVAELDASVSDLIVNITESNGVDDDPSFRNRIIGQLKAGRELIRVGEYKAYLLYEVLVRALVELIDRYSNPTIKALANALLGALVSKALESH